MPDSYIETTSLLIYFVFKFEAAMISIYIMRY